jgi:ribosomal protein S18 acetylase RimI-like enzyme
MPTIRPYQPKDKENVRRVCIACGPAAGLTQGPKYDLELVTFCDYYVECEPQNCFVIADGDGEAVGYILCAESFHDYRGRFLKDYAPRVRGFARKVMCQGSARMPRLFAKGYPAHMHINILEPYQRMGLGSKLVDALAAHLRTKGVPGLMLGVGAGNVKGRSFYNKYGFKRLLRIPGCVLMGLDL